MAELPWWWIVLLSGSTVAAMCISLVAPAVTTISLYREKKLKVKRQQHVSQAPGRAASGSSGPPGAGVELRGWRRAGELAGCPWSFDGCASLLDALERVWMPCPDKELQDAFSALQEQLQDMRVARVAAPTAMQPEDHYFAIIYTLLTGAELFGVAPEEHEISLQLSHEAGFLEEVSLDRSPPRRTRRPARSPKRSPSMIQSKGSRGSRSGGVGREACSLPSLTPFYRVHDGFGSVLTPLDLPALLSNPDGKVGGSSFYIYPARCLRPVARLPSLVKFARVDHHCVVCVDRRQKDPGIVYLECGGGLQREDYPPLAFAADTVRNITRARPPGPPGGQLGGRASGGGSKEDAPATGSDFGAPGAAGGRLSERPGGSGDSCEDVHALASWGPRQIGVGGSSPSEQPVARQSSWQDGLAARPGAEPPDAEGGGPSEQPRSRRSSWQDTLTSPSSASSRLAERLAPSMDVPEDDLVPQIARSSRPLGGPGATGKSERERGRDVPISPDLAGLRVSEERSPTDYCGGVSSPGPRWVRGHEEGQCMVDACSEVSWAASPQSIWKREESPCSSHVSI